MAISRAFYTDFTSARKAKRQDTATAKAVRLTKKGTESKLELDTTYFRNIEAAKEYTAKSVSKHNIYQKVDGKYSLVVA